MGTAKANGIGNSQREDLFDLYFRYREQTEPPAIFNRWAFIGVLGAWLGRQMWLPFGGNKIYPNHYIMFVGHPGSRKTTAIKNAVKLVKQLGYSQYAADRTSKEQFLIDLAGLEHSSVTVNKGKSKHNGHDILEDIDVLDIDDKVPKEMFIVADEFNNFMGNGNTEFQSILGQLWDWDDDHQSYSHKLKNSKPVYIYQPTISILSGNTPQNFVLCFPQESIGQGFMSRLILVHGESSGKKFSDPPPPDAALTDELLGRLLEIKTKCVGPMERTQEAKQALDMIYKTWPELEDTRFKHYSTRRYVHLLKLAMIMSAARCSTTLGLQDVLHANTVLAYVETLMPKAMGEVGASKSSKAADKIMQALYEAREPKSMQELYKIVRSDVEKVHDLGPIMSSLQAADKIFTARTLDNKIGYLAKQSTISRKIVYVDYEYLKGKEIPK